MTIAQAERFYEQDTKDYEINNNKEFLSWLNNSIANGYNCYIKTKEMQELIDNVSKWYELKYPEREMKINEGFIYTNFNDIKSLSELMDIRQLLFRLTSNQLYIMECGYRSTGFGQYTVYENGKEIGKKFKISMYINKNKEREYDPFLGQLPYFIVHADYMSGKVIKNEDLEEYVDVETDLYLEELLTIFNEKYLGELDFSELEKCINNHNFDIELRKRLLQMIALKLLYSKNTTPERGYQRAKRFINEFNEKLNLNLSTEQIDEIINRDYNDSERWKRVFKTYIDENGEEYSVCTIEKVTKKEQEECKKEEIKEEQKEEQAKGIRRLCRFLKK